MKIKGIYMDIHIKILNINYMKIKYIQNKNNLTQIMMYLKILKNNIKNNIYNRYNKEHLLIEILEISNKINLCNLIYKIILINNFNI
jgi:hypothetical protein